MNTTNSSNGKRLMRAWSNKRSVRATVRGERGRDGPVLWGTAGEATSRKQTHGVGNQAVSALRNKLSAWRNQAERASWEEGVDRETERQTRRDKLGTRATVDREGREDEIIVYESNTVRRSTRRVAAGGQPQVGTIGKKRVRVCGQPHARNDFPNQVIARQRAVSWSREHGGLEERLESSSRSAERRRDAELQSGETLRTRSERDRRKTQASRGNVESGGRG